MVGGAVWRTRIRQAVPAPLAVVLVGAAAVQGVVLWRAHQGSDLAVLTKDSHDYVRLAQALVEDHRYLIDPGSVPAFFRSPGYPAFLALVWLFTPDSPWYALVVQAAVAVVGLLILYHLAVRLVGGSWLPLLVTAVVALDPVRIMAAGRVLSETLFTTLLLGFLLLCTRLADAPHPARRLLGAGTLLTAATFVRPTTYYLPVLVAIGLLAGGRRWRWGWRKGGLAIGAFLLPAVLLCGAWQVRNQQQVHTSSFAGVQDFNLYFVWAAPAFAADQGRPAEAVRQEFKHDVGTISNRAGQEHRVPARYPTVGSWYDDLATRAGTVLRHHPHGAAVVAWRGGKRLLTETPDNVVDGYWGWTRPDLVRDLQRTWPYLLLYGAALGLWPVLRRGARDRFAGFLVVTTTIYLVATSAGYGADSRFRVPVTPLLAVVTAAGVAAALTAVNDRWPRLRHWPPVRAHRTSGSSAG